MIFFFSLLWGCNSWNATNFRRSCFPVVLQNVEIQWYSVKEEVVVWCYVL